MADEIKKDTVDYRDPTPFDDSKLQSLSDVNQAIRHKMFNKDVREPIAQGFENLVQLMQEKGGNQAAEVVAARGNHELLQMREDAQDNAIVKAQSTANSKFDANQAESYLKSVTAIPETFANLAAIKAKYPSGKNGLMVAADNGHKYIWTNGAWTDAGVYQSTGLADGSVTPNKLALCSMFPVVCSTTPININTTTKMIEFPACSIMLPYGNRMAGAAITAQNVAYTGLSWLVYDLTAETIRVENNPSGNAAVIGWISGGGWLYVNGAAVTRDEQLTTTSGTISSFATPFIYSSPANGDFVYNAIDKTLKLPKSFGIVVGGKAIDIYTESNGGNTPDTLSIPTTQYITYDPASKIVSASAPTYNKIALGYVDVTRKAVMLNTKSLKIINAEPTKTVKITYLGDSITEGVKTSKRYLDYVEDKLTASNYDVTTVNLGIGGTRIADSPDRTDDFISRWQDIPADSDVIVIFGGTNDYGGSSPMGEMTDDKTTFKGALNELIMSIQNTYPNADLLVLTPVKRYYRSSTESWSDENTWRDGDKWLNNEGLLLSDYVDALKEVAAYHGAKVIDLYHNSGFNPRVEANYNRNTTDGLHPNAVGHYLLYKQIYPEVLNCAQNREEVSDPAHHN